MATDRIINQTQGDEIIAGLLAIKNAITNQPVPTTVEDVVAPEFDDGVSYTVGEFVMHEGLLYKCTTAHHGAWNGSDFTLTTMGDQVSELNNALTPIDVSSKFSGNGVKNIYYAYQIGKIVIFSLATVNVTKSTNSTITINCVSDSNYYPKSGAVALPVCIGAANQGYNNVTCQLTSNGTIAFVGSGTLNTQGFIVSGSYLIA